jgi:hypothetical protein
MAAEALARLADREENMHGLLVKTTDGSHPFASAMSALMRIADLSWTSREV